MGPSTAAAGRGSSMVQLSPGHITQSDLYIFLTDDRRIYFPENTVVWHFVKYSYKFTSFT